jgi:hypothetical protein
VYLVRVLAIMPTFLCIAGASQGSRPERVVAVAKSCSMVLTSQTDRLAARRADRP